MDVLDVRLREKTCEKKLTDNCWRSQSLFIDKYFNSLPDPRIERTKLHEFTDILFIVICATLCSMEGWEEIEDFAHGRKM